MITNKNKIKICRKLKSIPVYLLDDYLISREGKLYLLDRESGMVTDISGNIYDYTKKGVPIYRLIDLKDNSKFLEIRLDKLVLNTFMGDLEGKIIHKDYDYKNCSLDNLKYELAITKVDNSDSLWINNKEFKKISNYEKHYVSNNGIIYSTYMSNLMKISLNDGLYIKILISHNKPYRLHRLVYSTWIGEIPEGMTINHKDGNKRNNNYSNLELMTNIDNIRDAHNNGLIHSAKLSETDVHTICKLLEKGMTNGEIAEYFNTIHRSDRRKLNSTIADIKRNQIWADISCKYNIGKNNNNCKYFINKVYGICRMICKGIEDSRISIFMKVDEKIIYDIRKGLMYSEAYSKIKENDNSIYKLAS
jgi:hypothetical protein